MRAVGEAFYKQMRVYRIGFGKQNSVGIGLGLGLGGRSSEEEISSQCKGRD